MHILKLFFIAIIFSNSSTVMSSEVYVLTSEGFIKDPFHAEFVDLNKRAVADLNLGQFKITANEQAPSVGAGFFQPLQFTNNSTNAISLNHGDLKVSIDGSYLFRELFSTPFVTDVGAGIANFSLQIIDFNTMNISTSFLNHTVTTAFDNNETITESTIDQSDSDNNGATYNIINADANNLMAEILAPARTIDAGESIGLLFSMTQASADSFGRVATDFVNTATISLTLPNGALLSNNANTDLQWVTSVPLPPAFLTFISGILILFRINKKS